MEVEVREGRERNSPKAKGTCGVRVLVPIPPQTQGRGRCRKRASRELGDGRTGVLSTSQPAKERERTGNTNGRRGLRKGERGSG